MSTQPTLEIADRKARVKQLFWTVFLAVIALHILAGVIAAALVVASYLLKPEPIFEARSIPAKDPENTMASKVDSLAPQPSFIDPLQSLKPAPFSLPDLPKVPMEQMLSPDPGDMASNQPNGPVAPADPGTPAGLGAEFTFMDVTTNAKRVLILYDISASVVSAVERANYSMDKIRDETKALLAGIGVNTRFGLGQFARNYSFFNMEMLPATDTNRALANQWFDTVFAGSTGTMKAGTPNMVKGGPGFIKVMEAAFKFQPDVIFVISDASFERGSGSSGGQIPFPELNDALRALQKTLPTPVKIHFIGMGMKPNNKKEMHRVMSQNGGGGKFREL